MKTIFGILSTLFILLTLFCIFAIRDDIKHPCLVWDEKEQVSITYVNNMPIINTYHECLKREGK